MKKLTSLLIALIVAMTLRVAPAAAVAWVMPSGVANGPTNGVGTVQGLVTNGGLSVTGSVVLAPIGTPSAPTMTTNGTAGVTSAVYACTAFDINGKQSIPSATATITTANATLSATNSVNVTCGGQVGAVGYLIHKVDTAHVIGTCYTNSNVPCTFVDTGSYTNGNGGAAQASSFTYTANTVDQTGIHNITFISGSTNAVVSNAVESFWTVFGAGVGQVAATIGDASVILQQPATIKNLNCGSYTILGAAVAAGGTSWTYALNAGAPGVAPTDTALTCAELTAATTCTDTTHSVQLAALSTIDFSVTPAGSPTAAVTKCSAEIDY
jgi:hypothetical protein